MAALLKEYDAALDSKKRLTVRGIKDFTHYHVKVFSNGNVELEPRVLARLDQLSAKTLRMMDQSMRNYAAGVVGKPIDIDQLKKHIGSAE